MIRVKLRHLYTLILFLVTTQFNAVAQNIWQMEVVYSPPGMDSVQVERDKIYKKSGERELKMDIYYPASVKKNDSLPVVIFVFGYPDMKLKYWQQYISWGKLTALNGMVGITYETTNPEEDLTDLIAYLRNNADELRIDKNSIGLWSCSANVPVALSYLYNNEPGFIKFAVLYYGIMPAIDRSFQNEIDSLSREIGFIAPRLNKQIHLSADLPLFIVRAGRDDRPFINTTIDHFVFSRLSVNAPITLINYKTGRHAFDILDDTIESKRIIKQTLEFMKNRSALGDK